MDCQPHYVRCVKSNDAKRALFIDKSRVQHQVKYLGLAENIKVRRAGYAYRCEFSRFLERFYLLSPQTYPDWTGADGDGCRAIVEAVQGSIPGLQRGEVQFGKSIIFVRRPETYFALCRLRTARINEVPVPIQRCWRRYCTKRETSKLPGVMAELYSKNKKARK
jgi:myosin-1